jgi:methylglutaconyl-CoA hydratase
MARFAHLLLDFSGPVLRVTLNRPEQRNALDGRLVAELCETFEKLADNRSLRAVVLSATGPVFCAGADLRWMSGLRPDQKSEALADAKQLLRLYQAIDACPCPVIGRIQGPAFGGGVGLVAVCDIVIAAEEVTFALSEARLGLVPAVIAPFLLRKAGESFLRRYALTGEPFSVSVAKHFTLVHDSTSPDGLDQRTNELIEAILRLAPQAVRQTKSLIRQMMTAPDSDRWMLCAQANAQARLSEEAQEGFQAFFSKRPPAWTGKADEEHLESSHAADG